MELVEIQEPFYGNGSFQKLDGNTIFERVYHCDQLGHENNEDIPRTSNTWRDSEDNITILSHCIVSKISLNPLKNTQKIAY